MNAKKNRRRGVVLSFAGQQKLETARRQLEKATNMGDRFTLEELSERTQLAISTITRVLEAQSGVDKLTLDQFFAAFDLLLERKDYQQPSAAESERPAAPAPPEPISAGQLGESKSRHRNGTSDWGEAIDVSIFYGRQSELAALERSIGREGCRLMTILGLGGMGKTALSVKFAQQIQAQFDGVIWRSLRNAPPLEDLLPDLMAFLVPDLSPPIELRHFLQGLQKGHYLVILDNLETLLDAERVGQFRSGYENYGELLRSIGEIPHQSSVIITSREKPAEVAILEGEGTTVQVLPLVGSIDVAQAILEDKGLVGTQEERQLLGDRYSNSPLALKIVATSIRDLCNGHIEHFLGEDTFIFNGIRLLLDRQFQRLTAIETSIMYWLAVNREGTPIADLHTDLCPPISKANLLEALEKLVRRSLIETIPVNRYTLQQVVMEYVTDCLVERVSHELITIDSTKTTPLFQTQAFCKTIAKDFLRDSQIRLILRPIAEGLRAAFPTIDLLKQHLTKVLTTLHNTDSQLSGYGAGNLINLYGYLQLDLVGADFSQLMVRYADFTQVNLQRANFTGATFYQPDFTQTIGNVVCVRWSPDGSFFATGDDTSHVYLWQLQDGQPFLTLSGEFGWIWAIAISPDSQTIAICTRGQMIGLWSITGERLDRLEGHSDTIWALQFSPNGDFLVSVCGDLTAKIWHLPTRKCLRTLAGHQECIRGLAVSGDGQYIATGSDDRTINLWDFKTGKCVRQLTGHRDAVLSVAFSPDQRLLASGSADRTIRIWQITTGECLRTIAAHENWIWNLRFTPNGETLISASHDGLIKFWQVSTGQCSRTNGGRMGQIWSADLSADGQTLLCGSNDRSVVLWDASSGQCLKTFQGYSNQVCAIAVSSQGDRLATAGSSDGVIHLWNLPTATGSTKLSGHRGRIRSVVFNSTGEWLASCSEDFTVKIWDLKTARCRFTLQGHENWVWFVALSPDDRLLATCSLDRTVKLWDSQTGQCVGKTIDMYPVWTVVFSPDGRWLATSGDGNIVRVWDVEQLKQETQFPEQPHWVLEHPSPGRYTIGIAPNSQILVSACWHNAMQFWDLATGKTCGKLETPMHTTEAHPPIFSPAGNLLANSLDNSTIQIWDVRTGEVFRTLVGHNHVILSIAFLPQTDPAEDLKLVSSSADETIKIWNVQTGECLTTLYPDRLYEGMDITNVTGFTEGAITTLKSLGAIVR
jgi:WD40 repeat protein